MVQQNLIYPRPYNRCLRLLAAWAMRCVRSPAIQGTLVKHQVPQGRRDRVTGHRSDRDVITRRSSVSAAVIWDTHRPGAPNRTHHFPSGQMVGTHSLTVRDNALMNHNREITYRPGPHPHRSARNSFGPHLILILHIG